MMDRFNKYMEKRAKVDGDNLERLVKNIATRSVKMIDGLTERITGQPTLVVAPDLNFVDIARLGLSEKTINIAVNSFYRKQDHNLVMAKLTRNTPPKETGKTLEADIQTIFEDTVLKDKSISPNTIGRWVCATTALVMCRGINKKGLETNRLANVSIIKTLILNAGEKNSKETANYIAGASDGPELVDRLNRYIKGE